ncbi:hypothetical protein EF384_01085 [Aerococcus agrisoli]|uniref:Uncharacterized protein n=1 Tax=Aerococcus agrisoli TaxID=2487350 RepID=A0A3N4GS06_9LACT|nr:hypothetical protein [Aerococcus agrisoli]RPA65035.1 hypothetical protein EF384_01085 [Aerococcus agrisoli]
MKLTNNQIFAVNGVLSELVNEKLTGSFKFKLFKTKAELERAIEIVQKALEGVVDEEEVTEIAEQTQDLNIELLTEAELEPLPLSMAQLVLLQAIIKEGDK